MAFLRLQKRLAAKVMKCGRKRVWIDPNETNEVQIANSRKGIKKLVKDGLIMRRQVTIHSRSRVRLYHEQKRRGRHMGHGKRRGKKEARMPQKVLWMRRQRVLRRLLKKYRENKKISKSIYHHFYLASKGNQFKNKQVLIEAIRRMKKEKEREEQQRAQREARAKKNQEKKARRLAKKEQKFTGRKVEEAKSPAKDEKQKK